jgi:hypothetical protein
MTGWAVCELDKVPKVTDGDADDPDWHPLQHFFGLATFGINAFVATRGDELLVGEHDERSSGQQELYLVLEGEAAFELDGQHVRATKHTAISVNDPAVCRSARALAPGTTLLVVGASEGRFTSTWNPEHFKDVPRPE